MDEVQKEKPSRRFPENYDPRQALKYIRSQLSNVNISETVCRSDFKSVIPFTLPDDYKLSLLTRNNPHGYTFLNKIGEGGCALVYRVEMKSKLLSTALLKGYKGGNDGPKVAKVSRRATHQQCYQERASWITEVDILSNVSHQNIVRCFEFFHIHDHSVLVTEYVDGGDLFDLISSTDSVHVNSRSLICQIFEALDYLHGQKGIAHMDLKVENVLVTKKGLVKLCDFGSAVRVPESGLVRPHGITTPSILPPEYSQCELCDPMACDVWSVGIIMYLLLIQKYPYGNGESTPLGVTDYQKTLDFSAVDAQKFHPFILLIRLCLEKNPKNRITVREALKADFFKL